MPAHSNRTWTADFHTNPHTHYNNYYVTNKILIEWELSLIVRRIIDALSSCLAIVFDYTNTNLNI
ncbi:hypothetical protein BpHYR1_050594 [Brachionus plicatilis]|uniref:Uncharacterized protein n=1 Tax=Brachionus plicatilis TaxID=10195 RepID=A0A3M7S3W1_BRAPC|nr:hypothetical protein BpHYR1_050594 [Brachionus plicatilis]